MSITLDPCLWGIFKGPLFKLISSKQRGFVVCMAQSRAKSQGTNWKALATFGKRAVGDTARYRWSFL